MLGQTVTVENADSTQTTMVYDDSGRLLQQTDPDGIVTEMEYDGQGRLSAQTIAPGAANERRTEFVNEVVTAHSTVVNRTRTKVFDGSTAVTVSISERSTDGFSQWNTRAGATQSVISTIPNNGAWTTTETSPEGAQTTRIYVDGRLSEVEYPDGRTQTYTYDGFHRVVSIADSRNGTTTISYNAADQQLVVSAPAPDGGGGALTTSYTYDVMGRVTATELPDGTTTTATYNSRGQQTSQGGSQTYDVSYTFDPQGRMLTMTTTNAEGSSVTTWLYDAARGWLTRKQYDDGDGTNYTYTAGGRLASRTWEREVSTSYTYNTAGELIEVDYSDNTPDVITTYTTWGAVATVTDGTGTRTMSYDANLRPTGEALDSLQGDRVVSRSYDSFGRLNTVQVGSSAVPAEDHAVTYGYDGIGRMSTVADPRTTWTYGYETDSSLLTSVTASGSPTLSTTMSYESNRDVLTSVENKVGSTTVSKYEYGVNRLNQRTARTQSGTAFSASTTDAFTYNSKGELVLSENDTHTAREFGYSFDGIGNRTSSVVAAGTPTLYQVNAVNQYVEMVQSPDPAVEPTFDADGNMTNDGNGNTLIWDGENRLVEFFPTSPDAGDKRVVNTYDGQSRRVKKQVYEWSSGWQLAKDEVFVYDGWNPVMIYDVQVSGLSPQLSLTWGRDLSSSLEGAGGVGGLLATHDGTTQGIMFYDANGNIGQVMEGSTIIAHYEYDPFGNLVTKTGSYADDNPFRFSTKFQDEETNFYYYGYRYYNPETGRWINRDPIEERGGGNLLGFLANNSVNRVDILGLCWSNFQALAHYAFADGDVTLAQTGCVERVQSSIQSHLDTLEEAARNRTEALADVHTCAGRGTETIASFGTLRQMSTIYSGVTWMGGISLKRSFRCDISYNCSKCTYTYKCALISSMKDTFEKQLEPGRSRDGAGPPQHRPWHDWEPRPPFSVSHTWNIPISGPKN